MTIPISVCTLDGHVEQTVEFEPTLVLCAAYSTRSQAMMERHLQDLEKRGVKRPERTPMYFPVSPSLVTNHHKIVVQGRRTSGEVEYVAFKMLDEIFVTVGSDHTDRVAETFSIPRSKQLCPKIIATRAIRHKELRPYWDEIRLNAFVRSYERTVPYQSYALADMLKLGPLIRSCAMNLDFNGAMLFSGTVPMLSNFAAFTTHFYFNLELPRFNFKIEHDYEITMLPEVV